MILKQPLWLCLLTGRAEYCLWMNRNRGKTAPTNGTERSYKWATVWAQQHDSYKVNGCGHRSRKVTHLEKPSEQHLTNPWAVIGSQWYQGLRITTLLGVVMHTSNFSPGEAKIRGELWIRDQSGLQSKPVSQKSLKYLNAFINEPIR